MALRLHTDMNLSPVTDPGEGGGGDPGEGGGRSRRGGGDPGEGGGGGDKIQTKHLLKKISNKSLANVIMTNLD